MFDRIFYESVFSCFKLSGKQKLIIGELSYVKILVVGIWEFEAQVFPFSCLIISTYIDYIVWVMI